jgi:hypothetical protein
MERQLEVEVEESVHQTLDDWREAEREANRLALGSAERGMADRRVDRAREAFHEREDQERRDYGDDRPRRS